MLASNQPRMVGPAFPGNVNQRLRARNRPNATSCPYADPPRE